MPFQQYMRDLAADIAATARLWRQTIARLIRAVLDTLLSAFRAGIRTFLTVCLMTLRFVVLLIICQ